LDKFNNKNNIKNINEIKNKKKKKKKKGEARLRHAQEIRQRALARAALARGGT